MKEREENIGWQMGAVIILAMAFFAGVVYLSILAMPTRSYTETDMIVIDKVTITDIFGTKNVYTIESNTGRYTEVCCDTSLNIGQNISGTITTNKFNRKCNTDLILK